MVGSVAGGWSLVMGGSTVMGLRWSWEGWGRRLWDWGRVEVNSMPRLAVRAGGVAGSMESASVGGGGGGGGGDEEAAEEPAGEC